MSKWLCFGRKKPVVVDTWDCSHTFLSDLPREVWEHRATLRQLNMSSNAVRDIPKSLFQMYRLESIDLSENELLFLPPSVSNMEYLTTLNLSKNSISSIPDSIKECHSLLTLNLSGNPLVELCPGMMELRQLRKLILNDIQLDVLSTDIGRLDKLEILELRENLLQELPASISHLSLLERLDLGTNEFTSLPTSIGSLESLTELWLDMNTINLLPEEICNLRSLKFLELSENHLMLLPEGMGGWTSLTNLYLDRNLISLVPPSLTDLHNLTILKMDQNRIGVLPESLDGLHSLSELNLSHNNISELPTSIGGMTNLSILNLDENILTRLPKEIGQCSLLSILSLRNNHLTELPNEISSLSQLSVLILSGNQLPYLPYTFNSLTNLTAVWITENQRRPMVDLQLFEDDNGEKCLTCFLFPQQSLELSGPEDISPLDSDANRLDRRKSSQVNFDPKVQDKPVNKISRDLTPFPKELHSKAMQWRASRDIIVGGGSREAEGDVADEESVAMRLNPKKRMTNRNSLLTALSEPLDEDNLLPRGGGARRARQRSNSREVTPHLPSTISEVEVEVEECTPKHVNENSTHHSHTQHHPQHPHKNGFSNAISSVRKSSGEDSPPAVLSPDELEARSPPNHPSQSTCIQWSDSNEAGNNRLVPCAAINVNNNNNNNSNNNNNKGNMTDLSAITHNSVTEALKVCELNHSSAGTNRSLLEGDPFTKSYSLEVTLSGIITGNEWDNSQLWSMSPKVSSTKTRPKERRGEHFSLLPTPSGQNKGRDKAGEIISTPGHQVGDYNHDSHQLSQVTPTRLMHTARSPPGVVEEKPHQQCSPPRGHLIGALSFGAATVGDERVCESAGGEGRWVEVPLHASSHGNTEILARDDGPSASTCRTANCCHPHPEHGPGETNLTNHNSCHHFDRIQDERMRATGPVLLSPLAINMDFIHSETQPLLLCRPQPSCQKSGKAVHNTASTDTRLSRDVKPEESIQNPGSARVCSKHADGNESTFPRQSLPSTHAVSCDPRPGNEIHDPLVDHDTECRGKECGPPLVHTETVTASQAGRRDRSHQNLRAGVALSSDGLQFSRCDTVSPTLVVKGQQLCCRSGHDTGFESTKLDEQSLPPSSLVCTVTPTPTQGTMIRTVLKKNPSLGIGLTGGKDGVNTVKPGDKGFHVDKVVDSLPAMKSGIVHVGDQLLEVNGVDVSTLTYHELLALFTGHQKKTSLLLYREAFLL